jgi:hypothetical protein
MFSVWANEAREIGFEEPIHAVAECVAKIVAKLIIWHIIKQALNEVRGGKAFVNFTIGY